MVAFNTINGEVAVVGGRRTPFARAGTELRKVPAADLAKIAFQETLFHCNCRFERLDEVILGNVVMPADSANLARVAALWAGIPPAHSRPYGSAQLPREWNRSAQAAMHIRGGMEKLVLAGGAIDEHRAAAVPAGIPGTHGTPGPRGHFGARLLLQPNYGPGTSIPSPAWNWD